MHITNPSVLIYHLTEKKKKKVKLNTYLQINFYHGVGYSEKMK